MRSRQLSWSSAKGDRKSAIGATGFNLGQLKISVRHGITQDKRCKKQTIHRRASCLSRGKDSFIKEIHSSQDNYHPLTK